MLTKRIWDNPKRDLQLAQLNHDLSRKAQQHYILEKARSRIHPRGTEQANTNFPSYHNIGDTVHLAFIDATRVYKAIVTGVTFVPGKVLYDLAIMIPNEDTHQLEPYWPHTLQRVDSFFVTKLDEPVNGV